MANQTKTVQFDHFRPYYLAQDENGVSREHLYDLRTLLEYVRSQPFSETKKKILGATSSEIMKEIKKHGAHKELRWRYTEALILGLIVIFFFAVLGAIIDETNLVSHVQVSISAGILVSYTSSVVSTCYYLLSIIGLINEDKKGPDNTPSTPAGKFR